MGDWPRLVNLRRCARGSVLSSGTANNTTLALTNDSTGAELILVWQFFVDPTAVASPAFSYQQIGALANRGKVSPVVPGDAPPPGAISAGDQTVLYTPDFTVNGFDPIWPATFPFAVLLPGWSLFVQSAPPAAPTVANGISYFWEAILPKYFDRMHTHYYLELALAAQGG